jgi:hypothetical protein
MLILPDFDRAERIAESYENPKDLHLSLGS